MEKLPQETPDLTQQNINRLAELFPSAVTETKNADGTLKKAINFNTLKQILSNEVVDGDECYEFTWVGKKQSILEGNKPIRKTLRPAKEESKNWDTTENLYIEGDNLEVLKLLQNSYLNSIKMIYIDPPYNTGNDFMYRDNFAASKEDYEGELGLYDEEENKLFKNTETNGRFHSDWCSMMYPRLQLARNLLSDDGVIFISIDDNEVDNLYKCCNEIFGRINFIGTIAVQLNPRGRHLDRFIARTNEYIVVYAKKFDNPLTISGIEKDGRMIEEYDREDSIGKYRLLGLRNRNQSFNPITRPNLYYPLYVCPSNGKVSISEDDIFTDEVFPITTEGVKTCWTWAKQKVFSENNLIVAEKSGKEWRIFRKDYLLDEDGNVATTLIKSLWTDKEITNDYGKKSIKELFQKNVMDFPKSPDLIKRIIKIGANSESIILDFFSGSATSAHAVMQLNAEDGGKRKFIMVQLPEDIDEKSEAYKAGYKNICDIGKERIRRAGKKIEEELQAKSQSGGLFKEEARTADTGFRVLKVDSTNMKDVYYGAGEYNQQMLLDMESNIKDDRTDLDLLFGVMVDWGVPLSLPHITEKMDGKNVHFVNEADLVACFDESIPESVVRNIAQRKPLRVVFRDSSFSSSPEKINVTEIFKTLSPDTTIKVI